MPVGRPAGQEGTVPHRVLALSQLFSAGGDSVSQGTSGVSGCHNWGEQVSRAESSRGEQGTVKYSTTHRTPTPTKNYLAQNVNSAKAEKPYSEPLLEFFGP